MSGYDLRIMECDPNMLVSNASQGFRAVLELTNPDIPLGKDQRIAVGEIVITWERLLDAGECTLFDSIVFRNYGRTEIELPVSLRFEADFQDVFSIRGLLPDFVDRIEMRRLRVGEASVDLNFERSADEYCDVSVVNVEGELDVVVETEQEQGENERIG